MFRKGITRSFSTYRTLANARPAKNLVLDPSKWLDLEPHQILDLFKQRKYLLAGKYKPDANELKALLKTSNHTGVPPNEIKLLYEQGELGAYELANAKIEDDHTPQPFQYDEYPEAAQEIVRDHREQREYNRIAAYEMPHLAKYRQEYKPPVDKPITYKYTTYLGEPDFDANRKVVLTVKVSDLNLGDKESHKFKLLAGTRYNHKTDKLKLTTERFEESLQNTRYLSDLLSSLISESKDLSDDFSDIPLNTSHVQDKDLKAKSRQAKVRSLKFPKEWKRPQDAPEKQKSVLDYVHEVAKKREQTGASEIIN